MLDVGQAVILRFTVLDDSGAPDTPATAQLRITLPDRTVLTPTVALPPADEGQLQHSYTTTQYGRHVARWITTGPARGYADVFNVADPSWTALVGLDQAKSRLNYDLDDNSDDDDLRGFILSASAVVEDIVGVIAFRTVVETASGGGAYVHLVQRPVAAVTQVKQDGVVVDPADYTFSPAGLLMRRSGTWTSGLRNIETTYVAGGSAVPPNVEDGVLDLIRINWRPKQGGNYAPFDGGVADDYGVGTEAVAAGQVRLGFFVPNTVVQRLQPTRRGPVVM